MPKIMSTQEKENIKNKLFAKIENGHNGDDDDDSDEGESEEDDDEGESEEDSDDDISHGEIILSTPVPSTPPKKRGRPPKPPLPPPMRPDASVARNLRARVDDGLSEFMDKLEFGPEQHKVSVSRLEPVYYGGEKIKGHLDTFATPVSVEEMKQLYGGGTYEVKILGPDERTGKGSRIKTMQRVEIAGSPLIRDQVNQQNQNNQNQNGQRIGGDLDILKTLIEAKDRDLQRTSADADKKEKMMFDLMKKDDGSSKFLTVMMEMMNKMENTKNSSMDAMLTEMREDRRRQEEKEREERRAREDREKQEREDRRREEEARDRRWREEQAEAQRRHEKAMAELQARMREDQNNQANNMQFMLQFLEKKQDEDKKRGSEIMSMQFGLMQEGSRQNMEMLIKTQEITNSMLTEALREAKSTKKGGIGEVAEQVGAMMQLKNLFDGGGGEEESKLEKTINTVKEALPSVGAAIAQVLSARNGNPKPPNRPALPPAMAFVDEEDETPALPTPQTTEPNTTEDEMDSEENDFTEYQFPPANADMATVSTCFVKNIDLAIRRELPAKDIVEQIVSKVPLPMLLIVKGSSEQELVDFMESRVPSNWMIVSPGGEAVVREIHQILKAS